MYISKKNILRTEYRYFVCFVHYIALIFQFDHLRNKKVLILFNRWLKLVFLIDHYR